MNREETLKLMEESYNQMTEEEKDEVLFTEWGQDWSPKLMLEEVKKDSEVGQRIWEAWAQTHEMTPLVNMLAEALGVDPSEIQLVGSSLLDSFTNDHECGPECDHDEEIN